jgi:hypothetical protein
LTLVNVIFSLLPARQNIPIMILPIGGITLKPTVFLSRLLLLFVLVTCIALSAQAVFSAIANTDKTKLFAAPAPDAAVIEVLKKGDVVRVFEKSADGQFWEVEHKGNHGWIISHQLSPKDYRN